MLYLDQTLTHEHHVFLRKMAVHNVLFVLISVLLSTALTLNCPAKTHFAVSQREPEDVAVDGGIYLLSFEDGVLSQDVKLTSEFSGTRPSYVAVDSTSIFSTNAILGERGELRQTTFRRRAPFIRRRTAFSEIDRSTYLSIIGHVVAVANFGGSIATFLRSRKGLRKGDEFIVPVELASRLKDESLGGIFAAPHPHMAFPYKRGILVPDLGSDLLWYFQINRDNGKLTELSRTALRLGDGPRHVVTHPQTQTIYVVNQVSASMVVFREGACGIGRINECDRFDLLNSSSEVEGVTGSAIRVSNDGRFLYISLRWPEEILGQIVVFKLDPSTGDVVSRVGEFSSCGVRPRDFDIVDGVMYNGKCTSFVAVANRDSNNVVLLRRDTASGKLSNSCDEITTTINDPVSVVNYPGSPKN